MTNKTLGFDIFHEISFTAPEESTDESILEDLKNRSITLCTHLHLDAFKWPGHIKVCLNILKSFGF